jgi:hypothetical protein
MSLVDRNFVPDPRAGRLTVSAARAMAGSLLAQIRIGGLSE